VCSGAAHSCLPLAFDDGCAGRLEEAHTPSMDATEEDPDATEPAVNAQRFKRLPERVRLEDTVESKDTNVARDPEGGRDTDRDFMIRYMGG
jgi:hypothetical protein